MMGIQEYAWPQEYVLIDTHEGYFWSNRKKCCKSNKKIEKCKIASFISLLLFVRLVFLINKTAAYNVPHVCYVILLIVYIYTPTSFQSRFSL